MSLIISFHYQSTLLTKSKRSQTLPKMWSTFSIIFTKSVESVENSLGSGDFLQNRTIRATFMNITISGTVKVHYHRFSQNNEMGMH